MRKSIATVSVSGTLDEKLSAIARAHFDGIEVFENDLIGSPWRPAEIAARAADLGLAIEMYQPFRDFEAVPPERAAANLRRAERKFDVMTQLGAPIMLVCSNVSEHSVDDDELAAEQLRQLAERAYQRGIRIAYEALAWGRHVHDYRRSWRIVQAADHPHLGICLDSFHVLSRGADMGAVAEIPGEKIFFVQIADAPRMAMDVLPWSRHYRCFPGQGGFDLAGFTAPILAAGYRGPLSLEVFNDTFRQADSSRTATDGMRSLLLLEEQTRLRIGDPDTATAPVAAAAIAADPVAAATPGYASRPRIELFNPPTPAVINGYAFAELSTGGADATATTGKCSLEQVLAALGFRLAARHRSKRVTLFEQGGIRVLLNAASDLDIGPSMLAVGLETDDQIGALNRAQALLAREVTRRRAPMETDLPTVRGPDGASFLFCGRTRDGVESWRDDFTAEPANAQPSGLTHIDHISLSLPFDQFDAAVLFFRSVLGMDPGESVEWAAPYGLIRSLTMSTGAGAVRMTVSAAQPGAPRDHRTGATQHVAFACDDIFATAEALRANGAPIQPVPTNYYDDVDARHEIPPQILERMRRHNVLYDRTADGEFFHMCTEILSERLLFEIVQRNGRYDGHGAPNAPVLLAAQEQHELAVPPITGKPKLTDTC